MKIKNLILKIKVGYTIVEFLVVLGVIGAIATISFFALGSFDKSEKVRAESKKLLSIINTLQNKAVNGAGGLSRWQISFSTGSNNTSYNYGGSSEFENQVNLPKGVYYKHSYITPGYIYYVCFAHPSLTKFSAGQCGPCPESVFWACPTAFPYMPVSGGSAEITFSDGAGQYKKTIVIEGSGMRVTRAYEQ